MKAQFADLPSGLTVPTSCLPAPSISPALNAQALDITINAASIRNIGNGFFTARRTGAEIDIPEGARQVQMILSDTMANVIGGCLQTLATMLEQKAAQSQVETPAAKIEVVTQ